MHVTLYDSAQYQTGISVTDATLYGEQGVHTVQEIIIGGVKYHYTNYFNVRDSIPSGGSVLYNAATDGDVTDKTFYVKENKSIVISSELSKISDEYWRWVLSVSIKAAGSTITFFSKSDSTVTYDPNNTPEYFGIHFISVIIDGQLFYGLSMYGNNSPEIFSCVILVSDNYFDTSLTPAYEGGASGSDPDSGYGDHDTDSDSISKIGGISGVIVGPTEHGLHIYELNAAAYKDFMYKLFSKELQVAAVRSFLSAEDSLVSLHLLPSVTRNQTTVTAVNVGALFSVPVSGTVKADTSGSNVRTVDSGFVPVGTVENDFLDYQQTAAVLYIPFCGMFPIDVQDIIGGGIQIIFEIDVLQGNIVANVYTTNYQGREKLQGCYAGNCAYRLPLCGNKDGTGMIAGIIQTATGALTGSAATAVTGASQVIGSVLGTTAYAAGSTSGNSAYYSDTACYLMLYRPNAIYPAQFAGQIGRPSGSSATVGSYSGFLSGSVHADISGATDREKQIIESYIKDGVVI